MADQQIVLCDTDVIIELYKNNPSIIADLKEIGQANLAISVVTAGELIFGALHKRELHQILKDISHLHLLHIDEKIGQRCLNLMTEFSLSHGLALPDAIIAATALHYEIQLFMLNLKDFRFIPNLVLYSSTREK